MRHIEFEKIAGAVESLCTSAAFELPEDVLNALKNAAKRESNPRAAKILNQLIENAKIAKQETIPLCQDTGLAVIFVEQGSDVHIDPPENSPNLTIIDAINAGVKTGYEKGYLRASVVAEPLNKRQNTGANTPAVIHYTIVPGDKLKITLMAKGGGCENKSQFKMFRPTADRSEIIDWVAGVVKQAGADACPPLIVGVGVGGDFELCCLLSKKALLRNLNDKNSDPFYAKLEDDLLTADKRFGFRPAGTRW